LKALSGKEGDVIKKVIAKENEKDKKGERKKVVAKAAKPTKAVAAKPTKEAAKKSAKPALKKQAAKAKAGSKK